MLPLAYDELAKFDICKGELFYELLHRGVQRKRLLSAGPVRNV